MANKTGHTIAGVQHVTAAGSAHVARTPVAWLALVVLLGATVCVPDLFAAGPGGKSRYRSASTGHGGQEDHGTAGDETPNQAGNPPETSGILGIRKLIPGIRSSAEETLLQSIPTDRLTPQAQQRLSAITDQPSLYRRLPTQAFRCDQELFLFLTRKPETIIGIWDAMGITKVQATRVGPYEISAIDGCGTTCKIDLVYGDQNLHVFVADGMYDGKFTQKPIHGKGVFVFKSTYARAADGSTTVTGTLDSFIKFESLGADLLARSLGGLIGKSADHNFVETAKFISQISQASETNPDGMLELVDQLPQVDAGTKAEFARVIMNVSQRYAQATANNRLVKDRGITQTQR